MDQKSILFGLFIVSLLGPQFEETVGILLVICSVCFVTFMQQASSWRCGCLWKLTGDLVQGVNADPKLAGQTRQRSSRAACGDVKHNDVLSGCRRVFTCRNACPGVHAFPFFFFFLIRKHRARHRWDQRKNRWTRISNQSYGWELINVSGVWTTVSDCSEFINYSDANLIETE